MRPVKLAIDGLTCFRDPQEIDFAGLDLFAISGSTGAGKTSILDAMVFALYGKVPRMGKQGLLELISTGRDRVMVLFDFEFGGKKYRITRRVSRKSTPPKAILECDGKPIANDVRPVNDSVEKLLGLGYEAFLQAVVLPQGQFAQFLQSNAGDRRKLLRELLRVQVYDRMRQGAAKTRDELKARVESAETRLREDFAGATEAAVTALEGAIAALDAEIETAERALAAASARLTETTTRHGQTRDLRNTRARLAMLDAENTRIVAAKGRLDSSSRAAPLLPRLDELDRLRTRAAEARSRATTSAAERARLEDAASQAEAALLCARQAASEVPALQRRIAALDALLPQLAAARKRSGDAEEAWSATRAKSQHAKAALASAEAALALVEKEKEKLEAEVAKAGHDAAHGERLRAAHPDAVALRTLRSTLADETKEAANLSRQARTAEGEVEAAVKAATKARAAATKAREELADARKTAHEAERRSHAAVLRRDLVRGEPCPVCAQSVEKLPSRIATPDIDRLGEQESASAEKAEATETKARKLETEAAKAGAAAKTGRKVATDAEARRNKTESRLLSAENMLRATIGVDVAGAAGTTIEERVLAAFQASEATRKAHEEMKKRVESAADALRAAHTAERLARKDVEGASAAESAAEKHLATAREETAGLETSVRHVTSAPDFTAERTRLEERRNTLTAAVETAQQALHVAQTNAALAQQQATSNAEAATQASAITTTADGEAVAALTAAGFADETSARRAHLSPTEAAALTESISRHTADRTAAMLRIEEIERSLSGNEVDDDALEFDKTTVQSLRSAQNSRRNTRGEENARLATIRANVVQAARLKVDLARDSAALQIQSRLASDLAQGKLESFVLEEVSRDLCAGASHRLKELSSGRYTLAFADEEFHVHDHDNAGDRRRADTLSGGETFLASLALALELSEQVTRAAGAIPLDSLFIDEGFGSLDPETLETVTTAIEALPVHGRMVGIITHLRDLTERLPARILVHKTAAGSRVLVESDAEAR
jgi:exonuclease SbcC